MAVQRTPPTAEALSDVDVPAKPEQVSDIFALSAVECVIGCLTLTGLVVATATHDVRLLSPDAALWLDVIIAFTLGCALNFLLSVVLWHTRQPLLALGLCGALLCLPYAIPFSFGIGASALAIIHFIGVWKALDFLAGTCPVAILRNSFPAFALSFVSPVEFRSEQHDRARIVPAPAGEALRRLGKVLLDVAGLSLAASVRSRLSIPHDPFTRSVACDGWLALYAEVWTILLFLCLFCDTFAALVACTGHAPMATFDAPLTRSTSLSDFWSRRWNLLIHGLIRRTVFTPLTASTVCPSWLAGIAAFGVSGLFHEYCFALQQPTLHASAGRCLAFFLAQAPVLSAERAVRARLTVPWPFSVSALACTLAWTILLVPLAPLFLHPLKTSGVFDQIESLVPRLSFA